jgi:hypothetical protein
MAKNARGFPEKRKTETGRGYPQYEMKIYRTFMRNKAPQDSI